MSATNEPNTTTNQHYTRQSSVRTGSDQGGNWCRWDSDETKTLTIKSKSANQRRVHWIGGNSSDCTGPQCSFCLAGDKAKVRWCIDVDSASGPQIWEMANLTFASLEEIAEMMGFLQNLTVRVKRSGIGKNTRYTIVPAATQTKPAAAPDEALTLRSEIMTLCAANGIDARAELKVFMSGDDPALAMAPPLVQLKSFLAHIRLMIGTPAKTEEPTPITGSAIYSMFAPEK